MVAFLIIRCSYSCNVAVMVCVPMSCAINDIFLNLILLLLGTEKFSFLKEAQQLHITAQLHWPVPFSFWYLKVILLGIVYSL